MSGVGSLKYNMPSNAPATQDVSAIANAAVTTATTSTARLHPDNPMTWLVGIGAVTLGLIYVTRPEVHGSLSAGVGGKK